jgi:hypothetical protein
MHVHPDMLAVKDESYFQRNHTEEIMQDCLSICGGFYRVETEQRDLDMMMHIASAFPLAFFESVFHSE